MMMISVVRLWLPRTKRFFMVSKSQSKFSQDHGSRAERRREARLERKIQRRLDQAVADDEKAGVGSIDDRDFFEQHPERNFRMRLATPGELAAIEAICGPIEHDDDGLFCWSIIQQIRPGVRMRSAMRAPLPPDGCSPHDVPEFVARRVFLDALRRDSETTTGVSAEEICESLKRA
jgi:hypothetical protein